MDRCIICGYEYSSGSYGDDPCPGYDCRCGEMIAYDEWRETMFRHWLLFLKWRFLILPWEWTKWYSFNWLRYSIATGEWDWPWRLGR